MMAVLNGAYNMHAMEWHATTCTSQASAIPFKALERKRMSAVDISTQVWKKQRIMYPLEVVEQPRSLGTPFVKDTDLPSSSSYIVGEKSTTEKTTHPSLLLMNYQGPVNLVWYLVADDVIYPHPYVLEGVDCQDGVCTKTILAKGQIISFPGLYVRSVSKEDIPKTLERRLDILKEHLPGTGFKLKDPTEYNLSSVRICFHVKFPDANRCQEMLSLVTKSLHSKEPPLQREPRILSVSQCKGSVLGREELTLRVTNLKTDDVFVFFHCESTAPRSSWQAFAEVISISRQKATPVDIVVKTPPYPDQQISEPQTVAIQIRLLDYSLSNTMKYTYIPEPKGVTRSEQKVKLREPIYVQYFTCLGASANINPVLKMTHEEKGAGSSRANGLDRMYVYKHKDSRAVRKAKPNKVNAGSQTEERYLRPGGLGEGYDSEEELGVSDDRVDYNRLERYRSLMMGSESPPHDPSTNDTEAHPQRGGGLSRMYFSPRDVLRSLQSSKSNQSNSSDSTLHQDGFQSSSVYSSSNLESENLVRDMSLVNLQSQSPHGGEGFSSAASKRDTVKSVKDLDQDLKDEPENSPSNNTETGDSSAVSTSIWIFGRHQCEFSIEGTLQVIEIVLRSPEASDLPDLAGSNLYPAIVDKAEFPVSVNKAGLVAVKTIDASLFQEEAYSIWCRLEHKNLITIFGIIKQEARRCLILEFPEEGCLERYLSMADPASLQPEKWWKWIVQAAEALQHLHKNDLAHQEITVANCLISADGNLMLNIPTNLIASKNFLEEGVAVVDEEFKTAKAGDILSFSVLAQIWLQNCNLSENVAKTFDSFWKTCTRKDRPSAQEVVKILQSYNQLGTSGSSAVPLLNMVPPSPDHDTDQQGAKDFAGLGSYFTDPIPCSPDSGIVATSESKKSVLTLPTGPERNDLETSRESAFSDSSQKNENSLNTLVFESVTLGHEQTEAGNLTNSQEGNKPSGEESPPTETQESANISDDDNTEILEERSEGGQGGSDRHEEGHEQNGRDEEGSKSHLRPPKVTKRIDHTGGKLELFNGEISLEIPPGALREGQVEDITLSVDWNDKHVPPLRLSDMNVAPVVQCGPTGLQFNKPVQLKLPHCAVIPDNKHCKMTVHCSKTKEGETPQWNRISKPEDSDMAVECQDGCFILSVCHFTSFAVTLESGEEIFAKEIMFVPYGQEISTLQDDQEIRIYLYNYHSSNREQIRQEEQYLGGKQLDAPKAYHVLELPRGSMVVKVEYHDKSWLLRSSLTNTFLFRKLWNLQSYDQCKFIWSNKSEAVKFMCRISAQQLTNDERMLLEISNHVKMSQQTLLQMDTAKNSTLVPDDLPQQASENSLLIAQPSSSLTSADAGISSMPRLSIDSINIFNNYALSPSGFTGVVLPPGSPPLIPNELMNSLCEKLDQTHVLGWDWTKLASDFGYDKHIAFLKSRQSQCPTFSPTLEILKLIYQEQKIKSLTALEEYFRTIQREDVAGIVADYRAAHTDEENMITSVTPSPDEINSPLTADQMPFSDPPNSPSPDLIQDIANRATSVNQEVPENLNQSLELVNNNQMSTTRQSTEPCGDRPVCTDQTEAMQYQQPSESTNQPLVNSNERPDSFGTPDDATPSTHMSCHRAIDQTDKDMENLGQRIQKMLFKDDRAEV
ncbi:uncharacterized protein LOC119740917 isoform X2 [Patiria miniata]|uniref:Netrin receptor UNC5 n=1 Tax=Patiria miniata TaxID=46514 RepID=A0A914B920_PATMI|nr:uncharacterized protein LOC119740917 isoform X2 [Patiria miniata]